MRIDVGLAEFVGQGLAEIFAGEVFQAVSQAVLAGAGQAEMLFQISFPQTMRTN